MKVKSESEVATVVSYSPWGRKESDMTERLHFHFSLSCTGDSGDKESACNVVRFLGQEDLLEKGIATLSSILAWRTPWTEEPGGLWSMGWQRIRHD